MTTTIFFQMAEGDEVQQVIFQGVPTGNEVADYFEQKCGGVFSWWESGDICMAEFPEVNTHIGEGQPEYRPIPAFVNPSGEGKPVVFRVKFDHSAFARIAETGEIWVQVLTFGQPLQPLMITTIKPRL